MNKEEFDILVNDILKIPQPKKELPVSSMCSINVEELRQVIEAFNKIPDYNILIKDNLKKDKEIERLNNIIDELEKYLEQQWLEWKDDSNDEIVAMAKEDKIILDKLKELKGSDK